MEFPFTPEEFFDVFRRYNEAVWPAQVGLYVLACVALMLAWRGGARSGRAVSAILALLWLWMAVAYHLAFFASINPAAAIAFGALFAAQGLLFAVVGVSQGRLYYSRIEWNAAGIGGALMAVYALIVYPLLGSALGHHYPASPTFGLPCPTTIFTLALLLWARPPLPRSVFVIPLLWAVVATSAALALGVREDLGLPAAALLTVLVASSARRTRETRRLYAGRFG